MTRFYKRPDKKKDIQDPLLGKGKLKVEDLRRVQGIEYRRKETEVWVSPYVECSVVTGGKNEGRK